MLQSDYSYSLILLAVFLLLVGCAEIASPPGGEIDRTPPLLVESFPENEAVNVAPSQNITLIFSEPVQKPSTGRSIYISPRTVDDPKIKWKSDRVTIELAEPFSADQTYVVTIPTSVTDLRRNRLDSAITIAFSTGEILDTGTVSGRVLQKGNPKAGSLVGLYGIDLMTDSVEYDSLDPSYLTTTDANGYFQFKYLPDREFRIVAFIDRNKNERLNPYSEAAGVADRRVLVGGDLSLDELRLRLNTIDTITTDILSASQTNDRLVRIRFSRAISTDQLKDHPDMIKLVSASDSSQAYYATAIMEVLKSETNSLSSAFDSIPEGEYELILTYDSLSSPLSFEELAISNRQDENPPLISSFIPDSKPQFANQIKIEVTFSEPIDQDKINEQTFLLVENEQDIIPARRLWINPNILQLIPSNLREGSSYTIDITEFDISDLSSNVLGDSLRQFAFSTLNGDSLGSISGKVSVVLEDEESSEVLLSIRNSKTSQVFETSSRHNMPFRFEIPAGKYFLSGFLDRDNDGNLFEGSLMPFLYAETEGLYSDTIVVRARFETAEVNFEMK